MDGAISDRLIEAAEHALAEVSSDPVHAWRQRFTDVTRHYIDALRHSEEHRQRAEALKQAILDHPILRDYLSAACGMKSAIGSAPTCYPLTHEYDSGWSYPSGRIAPVRCQRVLGPQRLASGHADRPGADSRHRSCWAHL